MLTVTSALHADTADPTTDRILDAAYRELLDFGVRRVSVDNIAKQAGIARITIYRRFANRDDLLGAVAVREGRRLFDKVDTAIADESSIDDQLVEGFVTIFHAVRNHPLVKRTLASEPDVAISWLTAQAGPIIGLARDYLAVHLAQAQQRKQLPRFDPRPVAELIVRIAASFVLTPDSCIPMRTNDDVRAFARTHLLAMIPTGRKRQ
jgi:AcrR family transcriptional regulator